MPIDLQYLSFLQDLRNATGGCFNEIFNAISKIAVDILPFLPYLIFLCVDRVWGYRFIGTFYGANVVNGTIKLSVCAYRPWIRSELIEPAGDAKVAATGYSFPSGHTTTATTMYGSVFAYQRKKRRWLAVMCCIAIALTGFSRNFLGVHTPQDVVVGFIEGVVVILVAGVIMRAVEKNSTIADILTVLGIAAVVAVLIYIQVKRYPLDYVDGQLLVDPNVMMNDCFKAYGGFTGFLIGSFIERHYIHYEVPVGHPNLPVLGTVSVVTLFVWKTYFEKVTLVAALGGHWGNFVSCFLIVFVALTIMPILIMKSTETQIEV